MVGPSLTWPLDRTQLEDMLATGAAHRRTSWVAVDAVVGAATEEALGHASTTLTPDGRTVRIGRILLDPDRRGEDLGKALIEAVVDLAAGHPGAQTLTLGVFADNAVARAHYARLGFTDTGETRTQIVEGQRWVSVEMSRRA